MADIDDNLENDPKALEITIKELSDKDFKKVINEIFKDNTLSDVEKMLVAKDLHRIAQKDLTYDVIGKILGISKVGAYKVEQRALKKLKKLMKQAGLSKEEIDDYDNRQIDKDY